LWEERRTHDKFRVLGATMEVFIYVCTEDKVIFNYSGVIRRWSGLDLCVRKGPQSEEEESSTKCGDVGGAMNSGFVCVGGQGSKLEVFGVEIEILDLRV